eukprot:jgi/Botrbrau1/21129/Bobra.0061s0023.1
MAFMRLSSFWLPAKDFSAVPSAASESLLAEDIRTESGFIDEYTDLGRDNRVGIIDEFERDPAYEGDDLPPNWFSWQKLWRYTGPGFLMSIAYLDPGNLESNLQAGAQAGYILLWVLLWSVVAGYFFQMLAAKLGVVTGRHLAQHCRAEYAPIARNALWVMTEIAIIGSDVQEVIGSAIAILLLTRGWVPLWAGVLITVVDSFLILFIERLGIRHLEAVFAVLISTMAASFGVMYFWAGVPTAEVIEGLLVPRLPRSSIQMAVAVVGAVVMPHNIYLHSALVHSRKVDIRYVARKREALRYFSIESAVALLVALFINIACVSVFAVGFYGRPGADDIGLENAGKFLGTAFGEPMQYIWAIGLLAAGQSGTMTGTYTGQFVMGGFLDLKVSPWARISMTRGLAVAPTLLVALAYRSRQGTELDVLTQWLNVLQSIQLPFAIVPVLVFTSTPRIVGERFTNSKALQVILWSVGAVIMCINISLVIDFADQLLPRRLVIHVLLGTLMAAYLAFILYLIIDPSRGGRRLSAARLSWLSGDPGPASDGEVDSTQGPAANASSSSLRQYEYVRLPSIRAPPSVFAQNGSR